MTSVLLLAFLLPGYQAGPAPATPAAEARPGQAQKGSIEGTVVDGVTGKPVKDATLLLMLTSGAATPNNTKSAEDGHFGFKDLDSGGYLLVADHPKYARQSYGSRSGLFGGTILTLSAGQGMRELVFKLQPNAIASGRVLDEDGDPVPGVMVAALRGIYQRGKRQFMPLGSAITNDLGEYRIANLAAGKYFVSATVMKPPASARPAGDAPEQAYITTYYPNAPDPASAAAIEVASGGDAGGLDIRLAKAKAVRIKGKVAGLPKDQKASVKLIPKDGGMLAMITGRNAAINQADGSFEIVGATRGSYTLRVTDPTGMKQFGAGLPLEVVDKSIEGVVLESSANGDLQGTVVIEGDAKPTLKGTRVVLESLGSILIPPTATVAEDGQFTLKDVAPGRYLVRLLNSPTGLFVQSVRLGRQQEMSDDGFDLGGSGTEKLEIKLQPGAAQVNGIVRGRDDKPISGVNVALIPDSRRYLLYQSTQTDQNGAYTFKTVTPGEYKLLAWEEIEPNAFQDPEFLKPFEGKAESVSLKQNDQKSVSTKAIPK